MAGVRLGMGLVEASKALRFSSYGAYQSLTEHVIPGGKRWDLPGVAVWRVQLDSGGRVVAVAGPWNRLTWDGDAVRMGEVTGDFHKQPTTEQALTYAFGPPDQTLDVESLGRVLVWDRLPTVQMQVHVRSGMAVLSMVPVHRLFADE